VALIPVVWGWRDGRRRGRPRRRWRRGRRAGRRWRGRQRRWRTQTAEDHPLPARKFVHPVLAHSPANRLAHKPSSLAQTQAHISVTAHTPQLKQAQAWAHTPAHKRSRADYQHRTTAHKPAQARDKSHRPVPHLPLHIHMRALTAYTPVHRLAQERVLNPLHACTLSKALEAPTPVHLHPLARCPSLPLRMPAHHRSFHLRHNLPQRLVRAITGRRGHMSWCRRRWSAVKLVGRKGRSGRGRGARRAQEGSGYCRTSDCRQCLRARTRKPKPSSLASEILMCPLRLAHLTLSLRCGSIFRLLSWSQRSKMAWGKQE